MDIQFTEAWYSPKSKQLVLFLCKERPKTYIALCYCIGKTVYSLSRFIFFMLRKFQETFHLKLTVEKPHGKNELYPEHT